MKSDLKKKNEKLKLTNSIHTILANDWWLPCQWEQDALP